MSGKSVVMVLPQRRETFSVDTLPEVFYPRSPDDSLLYNSIVMEHHYSYDMSTPTFYHRYQSEVDKNVNRLRNCMPDKFTTLVKMHLSFQLDLDGSKLEEIFQEFQEKQEYSQKKKSVTPFAKKKEKTTFFGAPLAQENIAQIYQLIEYLGRPENISTEGLFRKTGNFARQKLLKDRLINKVDLGLDQQIFSPHDVATVLKYFLSELPEPLLTERHYQAHLQVVEMGSVAINERERLRARCKQIKTLQLLMLLLPRNNVVLLECLIDLLHRVTKVAENMMTATSLGTVFAPQLLCPRKMSPETLQSISPVITHAAAFMIENGTQVFKVPRELSADIANFWRDMEHPNRNLSDSCEDQENLHDSNLLSAKKKYGSMQAINNTVWSFSQRKSSSDSDSTNDTQVALAELYAHVQSMPHSSKKKKLLKQFNKASQPGQTPKKHTRSRTFGDSIKKHLPGFNKHKRRGSSEASEITGALSWAVTNTINIDDNDSVFQTKHSAAKPSVASPAVHIVELNKSPETPRQNITRSRKRLSSESSEGSIPEKRPTPDHLPVSSENEITYLRKNIHERKLCPCTPEQHNKPVAMVSPITHSSPISQSVKKAPLMMQKRIMTPRSRAPMLLLQSPNMESRESTL